MFLRLPVIRLATLLSYAALYALVFSLPQYDVQAQENQPWFAQGKEQYLDQCAACHGEQGEGVEGAYEHPLKGDQSLRRLASYIVETMPEDDPDLCVGEDAENVTRYIMQAFYTPEAQLRNSPPDKAFSRLTVDQFQNSVADLMRPYMNSGWPSEKQGLNAKYFPTRSAGKDLAFERIDQAIDFDFGTDSPDAEKLKDKEQFAIEWNSSLIAPETGTYEFILLTPNGAQLFFNGAQYHEWDSQKALIDNRVTNGETEHRATVHLRAGRFYPFQVVFFKYKEESASIRLEWKRPNRPRELLTSPYVNTAWSPATLMLETDFPPDDSSVGYKRGTSVSQQWDRATTKAAVEAIEFVDANYREVTGYNRKLRKKEKELDDETKLAAEKERVRVVCEKFVCHAFRRNLTDAEKQFYLQRPFEKESNPRMVLRRVVLMTLKSPQFLYLCQPKEKENASFAAAEQMAIGFWDSIPDEELHDLAVNGKLSDQKIIYRQAWRMMDDIRTRAKVRQFFHHWLELDRATDATKDPNSFPGFDEQVLASLAESLDRTIDEIVWSKESDYRKLLASDKMFVDQRIADFYGIEKPESETFELTTFEPERRAGVLTHPYLMTGLAYHKNTSPIHRGVFVAKSLLGRTLKPPPVDVEPLAEEFDPSLTTRERVVHQTKEIACQGCHSVINPLGFSFENYDAVGRFRETEKDQKIDATSDYETPEGKIIQFKGAKDLAKFLVENESAHRNFIEQLFRHFAKQPLAAYGPDKIDHLLKCFHDNDYSVQRLIVEMAVVVAQHEFEIRNAKVSTDE